MSVSSISVLTSPSTIASDEFSDGVAEKVEMQLLRVLKSPLFSAARQKQQFLGYVVRKTLAGHSDKLKQYTIAVEGLGCPISFDSDQNPLIRIVAGRVREKLDQYYSTHGRNDPLIISIPKGSYIPEFRLRDKNGHRKRQRSNKRPTVSNNFELKRPSAHTLSEGPKLGLIGLQDQQHDDSHNTLLRHFTDNLARELGHFIFSRLSVAMPFPDLAEFSTAASRIREEQAVDYLLALHLQQGKQLQLTSRLLHAATHEQIWTDTFDLPENGAPAQLDSLYGRITTTVMDLQQGVMHVDWSRRLLLNPQQIDPAHRVIAFYRQHTDKFTQATFAQAVEACEMVLASNPGDLIANVVFADYCRREHVYDYGIIEEPLQQGKLAAETAIRLKPDSHEAHYVLGQILYNLGERVLCQHEFERAREISQYHALVTFGTGYHLCIMNQWDKGMPLVNESMTISPVYPDWYNLAPFLNEYRQEHYREALQHAQQIITPGIYWGPLARAACYGQLDETEKAKQEIIELLERFPDFVSRGLKYQKRFLGYEQLNQHVWKGLLKAGISDWLNNRE